MTRRIYSQISAKRPFLQEWFASLRKEYVPPLSGTRDISPAPGQRRRLSFPVVASLLLVIVSPIFTPAQQTQTSSFTFQWEIPPKTPYPTDGLSLAVPTVGLFIGVSDYGAGAGFDHTPAHTLGAAVMYDAFVGAATNAEKHSLFIPTVNYFKGGTEAVCGVVFSPDQAYIASGSKDGTVTLWGTGTRFGSVISANKRKGSACALAFSPDSSQLIVGGSDGDVVIQTINAERAPIVLKHPAGVCGAAFSPDGSKILTTSLDGATRIWEAAGTKEPLVLPADQKCDSEKVEDEPCVNAPRAAFSPDSKSVARSSCKALQLSSLDHPRNPVLLGEETVPIHSVSFVPDGSIVVSSTDKGVTGWPVKPAHPDASSTPNGSHTDFGSGLRSFELSRDGKYLLFITESGNAWIQDGKYIHKTSVPRPDRKDDRGMTIGFSIDQGTIPAGRSTSRIEVASLSPDARYLVAGYEDGSIGIHPAINLPEPRAFRADDQFLLADMNFDKTPTSILVIWYLRQLRATARDLHYHPPKNSPDGSEDPNFLQLGRGEPVTRQRIFTALTAAIEKAQQTEALRQNAVLIVYVAAHGWIGTDGRQYFLPADADKSNPNTWIAFDDFLSPIKEFLRAPSALNNGDGPDKAAIVIFDTCQTRLGSPESARSVSSTDAPKNLIVVEATSPGQYAWHWTGNLESTEMTTSDKSTTRFGITHRSRPKDTNTKSDYSSRMSMFPYASQWALNKLIDYRSKFPDTEKREITLHEWLMNTQDAMTALEEGIPEVKQMGQAQTVQVQNNTDEMNPYIFQVEQNASPPQ